MGRGLAGWRKGGGWGQHGQDGTRRDPQPRSSRPALGGAHGVAQSKCLHSARMSRDEQIRSGKAGAAGRSNSWRDSRRGRGSGRGSGRAEWQASAWAARPGRCPAGSYGAPQRVLPRGLGHGVVLRTRVTDTVPVLEASSVCALIFCFPLPFSPVIRFPFVVGEPQSKTLAAWQPALPTDMTVSNAGLGNLKKFAPASRADAPGAPGAPSPASRPPFAPAARG